MQYWENLTAWDNIGFYYHVDKRPDLVSTDNKRQIKRKLNNYLYNVLYDGHVGKYHINMSPTVTITGNIMCYNIDCHPTMVPKTMPQDLYNLLPADIPIGCIKLLKRDFHAV